MPNQPSKTLTLDELRDHTRELIANYKVPRSVDFVTALPVSGAGKVLKRELKRAAAESSTGTPEEGQAPGKVDSPRA